VLITVKKTGSHTYRTPFNFAVILTMMMIILPPTKTIKLIKKIIVLQEKSVLNTYHVTSAVTQRTAFLFITVIT
jgi:hypothetical protein